MKNRSTLSALVGASFFAVPYLALSIPLVPSLLIGGAAFITGEFVFKKEESKEDITILSFNEIIEGARKQNKHIVIHYN